VGIAFDSSAERTETPTCDFFARFFAEPAGAFVKALRRSHGFTGPESIVAGLRFAKIADRACRHELYPIPMKLLWRREAVQE